MPRTRQGSRLAGGVAIAVVCVGLAAPPARGQLRPNPATLAAASPELVNRLRSDPFTYFRFVNRAWTARVCEALADVKDAPIVSLHGDAHVEQFALTQDAWGLDDFDDSTRGPGYVDIMRFLGSLDLAARHHGWTRERNALWDRFFAGYRRGLADPAYRYPEPDLVRRLRREVPPTHAAFLAWGESQMQPMPEQLSRTVVEGMETLERFVRQERPELRSGYLEVRRVGWLRIGVGSATTRKVLIRVQGRTASPEDDELLEAKEVVNLGGLPCLEGPTTPAANRIIAGTRQIGRLKHDILAVGPTLLIPPVADGAEPWVDWWVSSWDPSYREVRLDEFRSVRDLADIAYDSGVQLGTGELRDASSRTQALAWLRRFENRIRRDTTTIVDDLLAGWRELAR